MTQAVENAAPDFAIDFSAPAAGPSDAPPSDALETEWLLTNGLGGFAMGTVCGCNTRRYHGLLIAARRPPVRRVNTLAAVLETLHVAGETYELGCQEFVAPGGSSVFHPRGWRRLTRFEKSEGGCRWFFDAGPVRVVRELRLAWRRNRAALHYRIQPADGADERPAGSVTLELRPLVALRDFHHQRRAAEGGLDSTPRNSDGGAGIRVAAPDQPTLHLGADGGRFIPAPDWWYAFHRRIEARRGQDDWEDLFTPGLFERTWEPTSGEAREINLNFEIDPAEDGRSGKEEAGRAEILQSVRAHVGRAVGDHDPDLTPDTVRTLAAAANDFVVVRSQDGQRMTSILAGYPWFADWGRDAMISLPGLLLRTGRLEEARRTLLVYARHARGASIPNRFDDYGGEPHYNTADAGLWYVHAALEYLRLSGDRETWSGVLAGACAGIIEACVEGTTKELAMAEDGLIWAGDARTQLTWMDARRDGRAFTPRHGKAVEINALWHRALTGCGEALADEKPAAADRCRRLADRTRRSFHAVFWDERLGYLVDHVNERGPDHSLRCNQVLAVSLPGALLAPARRRRVMRAVRETLLTPMGLRTLSPGDANYHGRFTGDMPMRDEAYHQGTVWPWWIGPYVEGWLRAHAFSQAAKEHARAALRPLLDELPRHSIGQLHEVFDGDPPHQPGGCIAQAWSVAEVLRSAMLVAEDNEKSIPASKNPHGT